MILKDASLKIIRDSRNEKTIEVSLRSGKSSARAPHLTKLSVGRASVPHGKSRGSREAFLVAPEQAQKNLAAVKKSFLNQNFVSQEEFDNFLIKSDGTPNKRRWGGNLILALSLAWARLKAREEKKELYQYVRSISKLAAAPLPYPLFNMINGGLHATNPRSRLAFQEFIVIPLGGDFPQALRLGEKFYGLLRRTLDKKFGACNVRLGDEAGFSAPFESNAEALDLLADLIRRNRLPLRLALDAAATAFKAMKIKNYSPNDYLELAKKYDLLFIEDPFAENDWQGFKKLTRAFAAARFRALVVADDLTVTNPARLKEAIRRRAGNAFILKPNQVGTLTETIAAAKLARRRGWKIIASHRSGETKDDWIADIAVGVGAWGIKAGAPGAPERMAKYRRLKEISRGI